MLAMRTLMLFMWPLELGLHIATVFAGPLILGMCTPTLSVWPLDPAMRSPTVLAWPLMLGMHTPTLLVSLELGMRTPLL